MDLFEICQVSKEQINIEIKEIICSDDSLSNVHKKLLLDLSIHNGKKLRPLFTVIGSYFGDNPPVDIYKFAAIFELLHTASLIHDDIIDGAETRRGIPSIHTITDNYTAVMLGNYLLSRCAELISLFNLEDHYYNNIKFTDLCHSEIMQQQLLFNFDITLKEYIEKTKNKTALLIAASFISGASLACSSQRTIRLLYSYAINLGISFQIIDDILDFTQEKSVLGKPVGQDLYNGNITLPTIYALRQKHLSKEIELLNEQSNNIEFEQSINRIVESNAIKKSKKLNNKYLNRARRAAKKLMAVTPRASYLHAILDELEQRTY